MSMWSFDSLKKLAEDAGKSLNTSLDAAMGVSTPEAPPAASQTPEPPKVSKSEPELASARVQSAPPPQRARVVADVASDQDEDADSEAERQRQLDAWQTIQRGHAIANGIPLLVCNRTGFEAGDDTGASGILFWGSSFVAGPQGELLAQAASDQAELLVTRLDMQRGERVRRIWPYLRDRRIDAYEDLLLRYRD